jgi:23S rRNA (pseudouridine1915-N3)-methyltransferase
VEVDVPLALVWRHVDLASHTVRYYVVAIGKSRSPYADDLAHYMKLLSRHARVEVIEVADDAAIERRIPERSYVCLLDAGGRALDSEAFARWVEDRRQGGRDVCFVLGGPFGTSVTGDFSLSLGPMTLPHLLARVVLLEQLFRAHKILAGETYHH